MKDIQQPILSDPARVYSRLYRNVVDYLRQNESFRNWLITSCVKKDRITKENRITLPDGHHALPLLSCKPEESVGLLLVLKPYGYETLRLLFPTPWNEDGAVTPEALKVYASYRTVLGKVLKTMDMPNALRHMHAQANWSFGMHNDPQRPQVLRGIGWAAMELGTAIYCGDVEKLNGRPWPIKGQNYSFESAITETHVPLGLKSVAYLPVDLRKDGSRILLAFYSPQQNVFGPSISEGNRFLLNGPFLDKAAAGWMLDLEKVPFFDFAIDVAVAGDLAEMERLRRTSYFAQWAKDELQLSNQGEKSREHWGLMDAFLDGIYKPHAKNAYKFFPMECKAIVDHIRERAHSDHLRLIGHTFEGKKRSIPHMLIKEATMDHIEGSQTAENPHRDLSFIGAKLLRNVDDAIRRIQMLCSQESDKIDVLESCSALSRLEFEWSDSFLKICVRNVTFYDASLLRNYWYVRQGLMLDKKNVGWQTGSGGLGLFLARQVALQRGYLFDITLGIPEYNINHSEWVGELKLPLRQEEC